MKNLQINADLYIDNDMSQINFDENFKILRYPDYNHTSLSLYTDWGNNSDTFRLSDYFKIIDNRYNNVMLIKYLVSESYCYYSELKNRSDLFFELLECLGYSNSDYDAIKEIEELLSELNISYECDYVLMSVRGYSQGDYAEILVNTREFKEVGGSEFKEEDYKEYFTNLFYDAPICGEIEISFNYNYKRVCNETGESYNIPASYSETINYDEWCNNEYNVDIDINQIIDYIQSRIFTKLTNEDKKIIEDQLNKIDYSDIAA